MVPCIRPGKFPNFHQTCLDVRSFAPCSAQHECYLFIASSLVHSHVVELFFPPQSTVAARGTDGAVFHVERDFDDSVTNQALRAVSLTLYNAVWLPILPFIPERMVADMMRQQRADMLQGKARYWVLWLVPAGRALLRTASALALAVLLTLRVGSTAGLSIYDVIILAWTASVAEAAATELRLRGARVWLSEGFNRVELLLLALLLAVCGVMFYDLSVGASSPAPNTAEALQLGHTLQSFATLVAWLRILRACYFFPYAGPQLLTLIYLLSDLMQFLVLMLFVLLAFGCAFIVCLHGVAKRAASAGFLDLLLEFALILKQLVGVFLNGEPQALQDLPTNLGSIGLEQPAAPPDTALMLSAFLLMVLFGCVVVVMLLSLVVARFSRSIHRINETSDRAFKLKFAQQTYQVRGCVTPCLQHEENAMCVCEKCTD